MILCSGLLVGAGGRYLLMQLPEPRLDSCVTWNDIDSAGADSRCADAAAAAEIATKRSYRSLASTRFSVVTAVLAAAAAAIAVATQPIACWPVWFVFATVGVFVAAIDALTTWLPSVVIYPGWLAMIAALAGALPASAAAGTSWVALLVRVAGCAAAAGGCYLLIWVVTAGRGIAFGDVRLMPLVGAAAGAISWPALYWSLLFGSLIGAVLGAVRWVAGRRGGFGYAPALVAGPYAAAVLLAALGSR
jgi:leader peptidase (prepilin peptidase)/N-methyltransferase